MFKLCQRWFCGATTVTIIRIIAGGYTYSVKGYVLYGDALTFLIEGDDIITERYMQNECFFITMCKQGISLKVNNSCYSFSMPKLQ